MTLLTDWMNWIFDPSATSQPLPARIQRARIGPIPRENRSESQLGRVIWQRMAQNLGGVCQLGNSAGQCGQMYLPQGFNFEKGPAILAALDVFRTAPGRTAIDRLTFVGGLVFPLLMFPSFYDESLLPEP